MTRTTRLFQLMQALRTAPPPATAAQLADALDVTPRTIYRDIEALRGLGAVIDGASGFGYTLIEDAALPPLSFEEDEIEALVLGLREVQQVGDPVLAQAAQNALTKLRARLPMPEPGIDVEVLRRATWEERTIHFAYTDVEGRQTERDVNPLTIVFMQASHNLLAWCHLRQDFRAFRLDRMRILRETGASFRPRRVPMLRDYLMKMRAELEKYHSA